MNHVYEHQTSRFYVKEKYVKENPRDSLSCHFILKILSDLAHSIAGCEYGSFAQCVDNIMLHFNF